ncbi:VPS9 domain-containing protein 1-like isoform X2 [Ptychodera flava]|uniref:VPS9 domain-containing protein 1-like isoform X2 n=1 Tax=Ptychodera flava TaxID=63121 RepID=UPI00396A5729
MSIMESKHAEASPLQSIMKRVVLALQLDAENKSKEAYVQYLTCMQMITETLNREAQQNGDGVDDESSQVSVSPPPPYTPIAPMVSHPLPTGQTQLYPNIPVQGPHSSSRNTAGVPGVSQYANDSAYSGSIGPGTPQTANRRREDLISMLPSVPTSRAADQTMTSSRSSFDGVARRQSAGGFSASVMMSYKTTVEAQYGGRRRAPSDPNVTGVSLRERLKYMSPLERAYIENQHMIAAYKARMQKIQGRSASDKTTVNLTLQRRLMDNLAIAQARQEALQKKMAERQQRLHQEAAERFSSSTMLPTRDEIERRQIYTNVMEYEHNNVWLLEWREKLKGSPQDSNLIHQLINHILSCKDHPITQLLQKYQYNIYKKLYTIIQQNAHRLENIKVPFDDEQPLTFPVSDSENTDTDNDIKEKLLQETLEEMKSPQDRETSQYAVDLMGIMQDLNKRDVDDANGDVALETQEDDGISHEMKNAEGMPDVDAEDDSDGNVLTDVTKSVQGRLEEAMAKGEKLTKQLSQQIDEEQKSDSSDNDGVSQHQENLSAETVEPERGDVGIDPVCAVDTGGSADNRNGNDGCDDETGKKDISRTTEQSANDDGASSDTMSREETLDDDRTTQRQISVSSDVSFTGSDLIDEFVAEEKSKAESDFNQVEEQIDLMNEEALKRHLDVVTEDVHKYLDKLQIMFVVAYEEMDTAIARDQCIASTETYFFQPIWQSVLTIFRLVNLKKEVLAATSMTQYMNALPQHIGVRKKFWLNDTLIGESDDSYPYKSAVIEIQKLPSYQSPLDKLECIVNMSRIVCTCVEDYYESQGKPRHAPETAIGCDDLLPILSYVVIKSQLPQLVSECSALEEFIHEGYLFGEEGYCLTSLLTALSYICKLSEKQPTNS